jgi:hypothetical protein
MPLATITLLSARQAPGAGFIILAAPETVEKLKATPATAANTVIFDSALVRMCVPPPVANLHVTSAPNPRKHSGVAGRGYAPSRQMPSASCAGRSEIENSTDCFAAICE